MHAAMHHEPQHEASGTVAYTPPSIAHVERTAQRLHEHYRKRTLVECQHALARMHGHDDWQALLAAISAAPQPGAFDEESSDDVVRARRARQQAVALESLGGVTAEDARAAELLERALFSPGAHSIGQRYDPQYNRKRIDRARHAYNVAYAHAAVRAVRPSGRDALDVPQNDDDIDLIHRVDLLPRALNSWMAHHRPLLERWSSMIGNMRVRQRCAAELLDFSFAWGELCLLQCVDIPKGLQIYPIALSAQWYAWGACLAAPELRAQMAMLETRDASDAQRMMARGVVQAAIRRHEAAFLLAQPREDFSALSASAREQQMHAGHAAVRRYMSDAASEYTIKAILSKPSWLSPMPVLAPR